MTAQVLPAHQYLDECGIPYERLTFPAETEKGAANVSAGVWGEEILLTPENLQCACNGIVVNLTERPAES
jgi:hypothetical protein